jgi:glucose/arabinose dehydrogenase
VVAPDGRVAAQPVIGVPAVAYAGQGGLLDVAIDPAFATNRRIYLSYAESGSNGTSGTAVARAVLSGDTTRLDDVVVIFRQSPKVGGSGHFGGRLAFAGSHLFITLGDRQQGGNGPQSLSSQLGKVVRVTTDGNAAPGNPFIGQGDDLIWSLGHRNVQGAAVHPATGELWTCEHGPQGGDEVNRTLAGANHGWPLVSYGCNYGDPVGEACRIGGGTHAPTYTEPLTTWTPTSIAPSGLAFYTGTALAEWTGNLFTGALAGTALWRLVLSGNTIVARERLFASLGQRLRAVAQGPDGWLYLLTDSSDGRVLRVQR